MSTTIGCASLTTNPYALSLAGKTLSFSIDIVGTTVGEMTALRQQLCGYVGNYDEPTIPFTWSEDSTLDGFYKNITVTVPSTDNMLNSFFIQTCQVSMEFVTGFSNAWFEVSTLSIVQTNSHSITTPSTVIATLLGPTIAEGDLRPNLTAATSTTRVAETASTVYAYRSNAPTTQTQFRCLAVPSAFYTGACTVEVMDGGSAWRKIVGRDVALARVWRISNGIVRLTSRNGATAGKIEIWDSVAAAWESTSIEHYEGVAPLSFGIGGSATTTNATLTILRNSPETVKVKVSGYSTGGTGAVPWDITYTIQRGAHLVVARWTSVAAVKIGAGFSSATACTAVTGGIRTTSNDAAGNRLVMSVPVTLTSDLVNGRLYPTTAATSGTVMIGVALGGSAAITGNSETDLINQYLGAVSWSQRVVVR